MITLTRKKELLDRFRPYTYVLGNLECKIKAGESIELDFKDEYCFFQVKYLYFKSPKILLKKGLNTQITIGTAISNWFILAVLPFLVIVFFFMTYSEHEIGIWNGVAKIIGIAYLGVLCYFPTFGHKKYLGLEIEFKQP